MSNRVILRQLAAALCICVLVGLITEMETPWSNKIKKFLQYTLSEDSSWTVADLGVLQITRLDLGLDMEKLKEEMASTVENKLHSLSARFKERVKELFSGWLK